ncbi:MAG: flagellar basal body rod protein FlgC [Deferribacterota bacterium]|nr:flagellar basal body rod protein FlgC [Deferribacterota bacterium]
MSYFDILDISATGMSAQRIRMQVVSANLANANTTRAYGDMPYRKRDVVFKTILDGEHKGGVKVDRIELDEKPPRMVYDPSHPDANEEGYVRYPNINPIEEIVNMLESSRSYEANMTVLDTAKQLAMRAIDIGRS